MQQAIPYKSWNQPLNPPSLSHNNPAITTKIIKESNAINMESMVSENAVIVFARRGCCLSHVVRRLLLGLGVNPAVYEVDEEEEVAVLAELETINRPSGTDQHKLQFPAVFIGGSLFGGLDRIMATHITGDLVPVLKEAKALWL